MSHGRFVCVAFAAVLGVAAASGGHAAKQAFLGVHLQKLDPGLAGALGLEEARGALISEVMPDSPADAIGLRAGDVIVGIDGESVASPEDVVAIVGDRKPGDPIGIDIAREGGRLKLRFSLGAANRLRRFEEQEEREESAGPDGPARPRRWSWQWEGEGPPEFRGGPWPGAGEEEWHRWLPRGFTPGTPPAPQHREELEDMLRGLFEEYGERWSDLRREGQALAETPAAVRELRARVAGLEEKVSGLQRELDALSQAMRRQYRGAEGRQQRARPRGEGAPRDAPADGGE